MEPETFICKIVLVGESRVGKTHFLQSFLHPTTSLGKEYLPTIGVEFATKLFHFGDDEVVKLQLWDTAGLERYRSISSAHLKRARGGIILYDVTSEESFTKALKWADDLENAENNCVIMLVGNKIDLCQNDPNRREIDKDYAKSVADKRNFLFFETSALTIENVSVAFEKLLAEIYQRGFGPENKKISNAPIQNLQEGIQELSIAKEINQKNTILEEKAVKIQSSYRGFMARKK